MNLIERLNKFHEEQPLTHFMLGIPFGFLMAILCTFGTVFVILASVIFSVLLLYYSYGWRMWMFRDFVKLQKSVGEEKHE
jgi:uncharacterized membrane protein